MENYIHIFKSPLKTLLDRKAIFNLLAREFRETGSYSIEMDDQQFLLRVTASRQMGNELQDRLLAQGHNVAFVDVKRVDAAVPTKTA